MTGLTKNAEIDVLPELVSPLDHTDRVPPEITHTFWQRAPNSSPPAHVLQGSLRRAARRERTRKTCWRCHCRQMEQPSQFSKPAGSLLSSILPVQTSGFDGSFAITRINTLLSGVPRKGAFAEPTPHMKAPNPLSVDLRRGPARLPGLVPDFLPKSSESRH